MEEREQLVDGLVWKLVLAYDGTEFHGWQVQPGCATVQGELRDALARITGEQVLPQGSGRTGAGPGGLVCPGGSHSRGKSCSRAQSCATGIHPCAQRKPGD
jgi:hypothetical protein